jgi:hypothetical protein
MMILDHRHVCAVVAFVLAIVVPTSVVYGQGLRGVMNDLVRGTARVADDVPVKKVDAFVAELGKSRAAREAVDTEIRKAGRLAETGDAIRDAARSDEVLRLLRAATSDLDPSVIRRIEQLDDASRDAALVLAKGGDELTRTVPDLAIRGRLVREGGADTVAAVGIFGPDAGRAALRLDEAIKAGSVVVRDGGRVVTVADFGVAMTRHGNASWNFWKVYIQPHWKLWAASGALAAYLANPEYFQDAAGGLTEAGFKQLTEFVGEVAAAAIRGVGDGSATAAEKIVTATHETYFNGRNGVYAAFGTVVFLVGVSLLFRRIRGWLLRPFFWLNQLPPDAKGSKSKSKGES